MLRGFVSLLLLTLGVGLLLNVGIAAADEVDFTRDIKPLLSNRCFRCHGPDAAERQGGLDGVGLRLDQAAGALADLGGRAAIVPGAPERSLLIDRIESTDHERVMPPPDAGPPLSPREQSLIRRWIQAGAPYAIHWAYVPPRRPQVPKVQRVDWPRNDVDRFLLARLEREQLTPSEEADPHTLIRRVSLDLTGLPPTVEAVRAFVAVPSAERERAYEQLVDRLLQSPAYGEHWAHGWLDLARYADSAGYADDPPRTIWGYRDYVIRALNANLPFDQFTIEQLAGDLLPNPTEQQLIATAFHRNTLTNNEGGTNDDEFRNVAVVDRVNTTMAVWMGTTMACAQCHSHKYDPISQEDYFRFFAIFNNTEDADRRDESPLFTRFTSEQEEQRRRWSAEVERLEGSFSTPEAQAAQARWEAAFPREVEWLTPKPERLAAQSGAMLTPSDDGVIQVPAGAANDVYTIDLPLSGERVATLRIEALPDDALPNRGPGHAGNFVLTGLRVELLRDLSLPVKLASVATDFTQPGLQADVVLKNPNAKQQGWGIAGKLGEPHALVVSLAEPLRFQPGDRLQVILEQHFGQPRHTLGRFRVSYSADERGMIAGATPLDVRELLDVPLAERSDAQRQRLAAYYRGVAPEWRETREQLEKLHKQIADMKPDVSVPIQRELAGDKRRKTHVQHRGNYLDQGAEVEAGTPAAFHPLPAGAEADRLGVARWLVDPRNPLTARVIVNRLWEQLFGVGIVATSEEFGSQGDLPFHPELLDHLAVELVESGWDMKQMVKRLVLTSAYRQSSRVTPELLERDPDNRLLARGPRFRLSAEMVRDQALAVSGLLSAKLYGPPVRPHQPALGLNAAFGSGIDWQTSSGEDRYRRALYTTWRRSNPYPSMTAFDAPTREVCTVRRVRTNTPLQALVTLNDPVYLEAAQALARWVVSSGSTTTSERLEALFLRCTSRPLRAEEHRTLAELFERARSQFATDPEGAKKLASEPLGPLAAGDDPVELAAWTVIGNVVLNLDEMMMKR